MERGPTKDWEVVVLDDLQDEELLNKIVSFLNGFLESYQNPIWSVEHFHWKLKQNPAGRGYLSCAVCDGEVVGVASITKKRLWHQNKVIIGAETGDTYSDPSTRKSDTSSHNRQLKPSLSQEEYLERSVFGRLVFENTRRAVEDNISIIYGTPNTNSLPGYRKRLNYIPHKKPVRTWIRPTTALLASRISLLNRGLFRRLIAICTATETLLEKINFTYWDSKRKALGYQVKRIYAASDRIDALWERIKSRMTFSIVRDASYFQHRFFDNPIAKYDVYEIEQNGTICGVIVTRKMSYIGNKKTCGLAEWIFDDSRKDVFPIMLSWVIHQQYLESNPFMFSAWSGEDENQTRILRKLGFFARSPQPVIFHQSESGTELLENTPVLDFSIASSDNI